MQPFRTLERTIDSTERAIRSGDLATALAEIRAQFGDWLALPSLTKNAIWGSRELDALAARIGTIVSEQPASHAAFALPERDEGRPLDVYLFTRTEVGGHVRVAGDFARAAPERSSAIVLADQPGQYVAPFFAEHFATPLERVVCLPALSLLERTRAVIACLRALRPDRLFVLNHQDDVTVIAAAGARIVPETYYVHAGDFLPALGVFMPGAVHLDLTPRAHTFCRSVLGIPSIFTPLVAEDRKRRPSAPVHSPPILATCGSPAKYDLTYRLPYHHVLAGLLANTSATFYHIGPLYDEQLAVIRTTLVDAGVAEDRWRHIPFVPSVWEALQELGVDLYVNSFPQRGARVAVEVMGSGTPAVWHVGEPLHQSVELHLAYPGARAWTELHDLIAIVNDLDDEWVEHQGNAARSRYETAHHPAILAGIVARDLGRQAMPIAPHERLFSFEFQHLERSWHRLTALMAQDATSGGAAPAGGEASGPA